MRNKEIIKKRVFIGVFLIILFPFVFSSSTKRDILYKKDNESNLIPRTSGGFIWNYVADSNVPYVAISSDGNYSVAATNGYVYLFRNNDSTPQWSALTKGSNSDLAITPNGTFIAVTSTSSVFLFNKSSLIPMFNHTNPDEWFSGPIAISDNADYIVAGIRTNAGEGKVQLFNKSGKILWNFSASGQVQSVAISSDGKYIAAGTSGTLGVTTKVYFFNRTDPTPKWSFTAQSTIRQLDMSENGSYLIAGGGSGSPNLYFFNTSDSNPLWNYTTGGSEVHSLKITPDGYFIIVGVSGNIGKVIFFNKTSNNPIWEDVHTGGADVASIWSIDISDDGNNIIAGCANNNLYAYYKTSSNPISSYKAKGYVYSVAISSNGNEVIAGCYDNKIYFFTWDSLIESYLPSAILIAADDDSDNGNANKVDYSILIFTIIALIGIGILGIGSISVVKLMKSKKKRGAVDEKIDTLLKKYEDWEKSEEGKKED